MNFNNRICQKLHEEHNATVALLERLQQLLARNRGSEPPDATDAAVSRLLSDLATVLGTEIDRHFAFEEDHLFTYLADMGNSAIGEHLTSEHRIILPLGARVVAIARAVAGRAFTPAEWDEFERVGRQLVDQLVPHAQKEDMALLPMIDDSMDPQTEARLYQDYVENG
jgi:iron-sulfur cluster repair protein YtfE (RIC family)